MRNKQEEFCELLLEKLQGLILIFVTLINLEKFYLLLEDTQGVYKNVESKNLAHHINIKCQEKVPNNKQRAIQTIGFL